MKKVILIDKRENFASDISTHLMIEDRNIILLGYSSKSTDVSQLVYDNEPDILLIADNVLPERDDWYFPTCKTVGYTTNRSEDVFAERGILSLGYIRSSEHLLNLLEGELPELPDKPVNKTKVEEINDFDDELTDYSKPIQKCPTQQTQKPVYQYGPEVIEKSPIETLPYKQNPNAATVQHKIYADNMKTRLNAMAEEKQLHAAQSRLQADLEKARKTRKTKVVTVYAAKGGVGKTTIATELATYLARTSIGRGYLRVCIIDCNIDFGDVLNTLNYDKDGANLVFWTSEIKERLAKGEKPKNIVYTKEEIERKLQKSDATGLYALVAPVAHEDSMIVEGNEFEIILNNIIAYGGFDFIVCDTGNNTRDCSMLALSASDDILLVVTQDVSTASCNKAWIETMKNVGFDMPDIHLVINQILPYKYTDVSIEELEELFPYPCVARLKRSPDITKANNRGEPIVLSDPNHDFSTGMGEIVAMLTNSNEKQVVSKQGLFGKLFGRKGR